MPPKKPAIKVELSSKERARRAFARRRFLSSVVVTSPYYIQPKEGDLFKSFADAPEFKSKKKKPSPKKVFESPNDSDVSSSNDGEPSVQLNLPEPDDDDEEQVRKMNAAIDSFGDSSLEVFNNDGVRIRIENGKHIVHEKQPNPAWRPGVREEYVGNYPRNKPVKKLNRKKKDAKVIDPAPKPQPLKIKMPSTQMTIQESICMSVRVAREKQIRKALVEDELFQTSFRVFGTPRFNNVRSLRIQRQASQESDRLSMFNYTPIRKIFTNELEETVDNIADYVFSPNIQDASTPIEKVPAGKKSRTATVFKDEMEPGDKVAGNSTEMAAIISDGMHSISPISNAVKNWEENVFEDKIEEKENSISSMTMEPLYKNEEKAGVTATNRKAETSVTELLDLEMKQSTEDNKNASQYSKKRQRTTSPETLCLGMNTEITIQNEPEQLHVVLEPEKEISVIRKGALQPQWRQRDRESAVSSCHDSINSAMDEMTLDQPLFDEDTMGNDFGKTHLSESRAESRNIPTGMTILNEDPSMLPFYLSGQEFDVDPSPMQQLLYVVGQKEAKSWSSLPKGAFNEKVVKKLGEGAYGEVFSTIWNGKPVAIKVVPFEIDTTNRQYKGVYHSVEMQSADIVLPEVVVMKELSALRNMENPNATPNFIEMISAEVVIGNYPKGLQKAWNKYARLKESENTSPHIYSSKNQHFIVFVTENGGVALEDFVLESEHEIYSILIQLILSIQIAELELEFEHRDLHLGNVLIDRNGVEELEYRFHNNTFPLKAHGVKVNIIDFTFSRIAKGSTTVFLDLETDPDVFTGSGDSQFDIYREMRVNCKGKWKQFESRTNLMWIKFIANRLINSKICPDGLLTVEKKNELQKFVDRLGSFESCGASFVDTDFYNDFYMGYFGEVANLQ